MEELNQDLMIGVYHVLKSEEVANVFLLLKDGRTVRCYLLENGMVVASYESLKDLKIVVEVKNGI